MKSLVIGVALLTAGLGLGCAVFADSAARRCSDDEGMVSRGGACVPWEFGMHNHLRCREDAAPSWCDAGDGG